MSVLVKGWTIPKGCADCPTWCKLYLQRREFRHPDCPLIEIPTPHGRLIDADKFKADHSMKNDCAECEKELQGSSRSCEYDRIYSKMDFCEWIDNVATVIEAEE